MPSRRDEHAASAALNARLPRTRLIAQGVLRDPAGRILLCELTYKQAWDLPGGVVDPHESPAAAVVREIAEELSVEVQVRGLLTVNWLPPYRAWDDALLLVFDLGTLTEAEAAGLQERVRLQPREIRAIHWCTAEDVAEHAAPYVARHLAHLWGGGPEATLVLEDGKRLPWS